MNFMRNEPERKHFIIPSKTKKKTQQLHILKNVNFKIKHIRVF